MQLLFASLFYICIQAYIMKSLIKFVFNLIEKTFPLCIIFSLAVDSKLCKISFCSFERFSEPQWLPLQIGRLFPCRQVFNTLVFNLKTSPGWVPSCTSN